MSNGVDPNAIPSAAAWIASGGVLAFPTETVYGLGADALNDEAVAKVFALKGRPSDHPLIVHIQSPAQVSAFVVDADIPTFARQLMATFWPGPLTVILPRKAHAASASAGGQSSIGLRCPAHPIAQALLEAALQLGVQGIAAPSANRFGRLSPTRAEHVRDEFAQAVPILEGGPCEVGIESTIVDCTRGTPIILRPGMLGRAALEAVLGMAVQDAGVNPTVQAQSIEIQAAPKASGTLTSHYAPRAKVRLLARLPDINETPKDVACYALPQAADVAAHELFARLRELDRPEVREIWVSSPPGSAEWDAVRDRLRRAASGDENGESPI